MKRQKGADFMRSAGGGSGAESGSFLGRSLVVDLGIAGDFDERQARDLEAFAAALDDGLEKDGALGQAIAVVLGGRPAQALGLVGPGLGRGRAGDLGRKRFAALVVAPKSEADPRLPGGA